MYTMKLTPEEWSEQQFGKANLGDVRRTRRAVKLGSQMYRQPDKSLPAQTMSWADTKASYRLFNEEDVTFAAITEPHHQATLAEASARPVTLMNQDSATLDFSSHPATADLGPVGDGDGWGFILHTTLAVVPSGCGEVLGMVDQRLFCRKGIHRKETKAVRRRRRRESEIWPEVVRAVGPSPAGHRWVHVCDREGDNFELFAACQEVGVDFVIRVVQDRCCAPGHAADQPTEHLLRWARGLPAAGEKTLSLRQRPTRQAREARLKLAFAPVTVFPPLGERKKYAPWRGWVVRVWEEETPQGEEPIEWVLLTPVRVQTVEEAKTISFWYSLRWLIEEYHKCLKTGCRVEDRQLETRSGLEPCIGMLSIVAVALLQLKFAARTNPDQPARKCLSPLHVRVVAEFLRKPMSTLTAGELWRGVARMGGFLNRKHDGDPGWQTVWRGMRKLDAMVEGARLAQSWRKKCG